MDIDIAADRLSYMIILHVLLKISFLLLLTTSFEIPERFDIFIWLNRKFWIFNEIFEEIISRFTNINLDSLMYVEYFRH